jgi:hypothetical protein
MMVRLGGAVFYRSYMLSSRTSHVYSETVCVHRFRLCEVLEVSTYCYYVNVLDSDSS